MFKENFFVEKNLTPNGTSFTVRLPYPISLADTLECGQCFRYEKLISTEGDRYLITAGVITADVLQKERGELIFNGIDENSFQTVIRPLFSLDTDFGKIRCEIEKNADTEFMKNACNCGEGIAILTQAPFETVVSFIISQNNNIPRIKKIIRSIAAEYGENIAVRGGAKECPAGKIECTPCEEKCKECGICYTFPTAQDIVSAPEKLLPSHPGFRYKYIVDAAQKVASGEIDLEKIREMKSYEYTLEQLKRIKGVGDKVASCCALFAFSNLEAFPIDVWMRRAIDEYFGGTLDTSTFGQYAGVAQQYIFHYIRNINPKG